MLIIERLIKTYGEKKTVDGLNLHIRPGEIFGLIGHNGAGTYDYRFDGVSGNADTLCEQLMSGCTIR